MGDRPLRVVFVTRRHLLIVCAAIAFAVGVWIGASEPIRPVMQEQGGISPPAAVPIDRPVREVPGVEGAVALTINVDWGNDELLQMLDVFDRYGVKATFFPTGRWAKAFPDLAKEVASRGHEIGNHGLSHAHPTRISKAELVALIQENAALLKEITGVEPVPLFAPPYGEQDDRVVQTAAALGHWTTLWTLDTIDWQEPPPRTILARIVPRARGGAIVLMHPKPQTVEALPAMLEGLKERGFEVVPLYQLMGRPTP